MHALLSQLLRGPSERASSEMKFFIFALVVLPAAALNAIDRMVMTRRAVLSASVFGLSQVPMKSAHASYAMQQANVESHTWQATGLEKERAVYEAIEQKVDEHRRFRPEVGELGYVGGDYTKKASAARAEYDQEKRRQQKTQQAVTSMGYARAQDYMFK